MHDHDDDDGTMTISCGVGVRADNSDNKIMIGGE